MLTHYKAEIENARREGLKEGNETARQQIETLSKKIASMEGRTTGDVEAIEKAKAEGLTAGRDEAAKAAKREIDDLQNKIDRLLSDTQVRDTAAHKEIQTLKTLVRQLENKPLNPGHQAEFKLLEKLRDRFPEDEISPVPPGTEGADVVHEVVEDGKTCGIILYESKDSTVFREDWVTKLHDDQLAKKAQHAILSTYKLPAGADDQVDVQDGVIIAKPERVPVLAEILRREIVENYKIGVSDKGRGQKTDALYKYITSQSFKQQLDAIESLTKKMRDLQVGEERAHKRLWRKRETLVKAIEDAHSELHADIDQIIDQNDGDEL